MNCSQPLPGPDTVHLIPYGTVPRPESKSQLSTTLLSTLLAGKTMRRHAYEAELPRRREKEDARLQFQTLSTAPGISDATPLIVVRHNIKVMFEPPRAPCINAFKPRTAKRFTDVLTPCLSSTRQDLRPPLTNTRGICARVM
jgi:hypothetical protein